MKITRYHLKTDKKLIRDYRFAIVADLHAHPCAEIMAILLHEKPDAVLVPGDLCNALDGTCDEENQPGFDFLRTCAAHFRTFYALGNHEAGSYFTNRGKAKRFSPDRDVISYRNRCRIAESGAVFLDNAFTDWEGIRIGGLRSGLASPGGRPELSFLSDEPDDGKFRILLCHHPEYYPVYLRQLPLDMVVSGHAHGGQMRFFGKGVYAPGQGLFPRYCGGFHENRLVISRGVCNTAPVPRLFNPCEVVCVTVSNS